MLGYPITIRPLFQTFLVNSAYHDIKRHSLTREGAAAVADDLATEIDLIAETIEARLKNDPVLKAAPDDTLRRH